MRSIVAAALTLSALMPLQAGAASITVKPGDTISGLADRYGVSVGSLMRANGIRNSNHVEVGQTLRLPSGARGVVSAGQGRHTVKGGDTLGGIAAQYRVSERDLIAINSLQSADHVELGQTLKLPTTAVLPKPKPVAKAKPTPIKANPSATSHTVARGQTLTQIARAYEVPVASLIDLNTINDPNKVTIGTKLMLRDTSPTELVSTSVQTSTTPEAKPVLTATASQPTKTVQTKPVQANRSGQNGCHEDSSKKSGSSKDHSNPISGGQTRDMAHVRPAPSGLEQLAIHGRQHGGSNLEQRRQAPVRRGELLCSQNQCHQF